MGTVGTAIFVTVLLLILAADVFAGGIGIRTVRKVSAGRWPPEEVTTRHRVAGIVVGWLLILSVLAVAYALIRFWA